MEEGIREWCIEKAMELCLSSKDIQSFTTEAVITCAKELEKYIRGN